MKKSLSVKPEDSRAEESGSGAATDISEPLGPALPEALPEAYTATPLAEKRPPRGDPGNDILSKAGATVLGRWDLNERYGVGRLSAWAPNATTGILIRGRSDRHIKTAM